MEHQADDYVALKKRLLGRIIFAVVVLAGLLASLAVFDRMNAPEPAPEKRPTADPLAKAGAPALKPPVPDTIKSEQTKAEVAATDTAVTVPEGSATPKSTVPQAPVDDKPLTRPATGRHALMRSPEPATPPMPRPAPAQQPSAVRPPLTGPTPPRSAEAAGPQRPIAQATDSKPFALQLGVFSDVANAEELRAKLELAGIKATIEARVRVGPFATRAEADAARAKLRELGISEAMLLSTKGRKAP